MQNAGSRVWMGRLGIFTSLAIWLVSLPVLGRSLGANQAATGRGLYHVGRGAAGPPALHAVAVLWGFLFVVLQLLAPLLMSFTLRAVYRLRVAVCLSISALCSIALDIVGMVAMLVWLRIEVGGG